VNKVLAAALLLLPLARAHGLPWGADRDPMDAKATMRALEERLLNVRKSVDAEVKDPKAHGLAIGYINEAARRIEVRKQALTSGTNYPIEVKYLEGSFKALIIEPVEQVMRIARISDVKARDAQLDSITTGAAARVEAFDKKFFKEHPDDVAAAVEARAKTGRKDLPHDDQTWAAFKANAPVIRIGSQILLEIVSTKPSPQP
jgi:hypothetical protein